MSEQSGTNSADRETDLWEDYFAGEASPEEITELQQIVRSRGEDVRLLSATADLFRIRPRTDLSQLWLDRLHARLGGSHQSAVRGARSAGHIPRGIFKGQTLRRHLWSPTAAFVLGIMVAALGWTASLHHIGHRAVGSSLTYNTGNGERATIILPDGGTVALNVASRLEIPTDYSAGNHTVRLVGEGVFMVQHHAGTPLTVLAGPAAVRVLGTSFLVRKYATDSVATVAVRDGKVAIRSVVLTATQQVAVGRTGLSGIQSADTAQFNFTRGVLTLDGVLFPEAIVELDRWYDANIQLGDPRLATLRMTGEVGAGSLAELSYNLEHTYKVRVVRNGRVLTLYPGQ